MSTEIAPEGAANDGQLIAANGGRKTTRQEIEKKHPMMSSDFFRNSFTGGALVLAAAGLVIQAIASNKASNDQTTQLAAQTFLTREMSSDAMWTGYMELAVRYPQFANGADYTTLSESERVQYQWFFERLAYTAESILFFQSANERWVGVFEDEIARHESLLEEHPEIVPEGLCYYDEIVADMFAKASDLARARIGECSWDEE